MWGHPHHNALPTVKGLGSEQTAKDYQETGAGLVRKVEDGGTDITLGKYFKEQINYLILESNMVQLMQLLNIPILSEFVLMKYLLHIPLNHTFHL